VAKLLTRDEGRKIAVGIAKFRSYCANLKGWFAIRIDDTVAFLICENASLGAGIMSTRVDSAEEAKWRNDKRSPPPRLLRY
jgi:hypothetical protein